MTTAVQKRKKAAARVANRQARRAAAAEEALARTERSAAVAKVRAERDPRPFFLRVNEQGLPVFVAMCTGAEDSNKHPLETLGGRNGVLVPLARWDDCHRMLFAVGISQKRRDHFISYASSRQVSDARSEKVGPDLYQVFDSRNGKIVCNVWLPLHLCAPKEGKISLQFVTYDEKQEPVAALNAEVADKTGAEIHEALYHLVGGRKVAPPPPTLLGGFFRLLASVPVAASEPLRDASASASAASGASDSTSDKASVSASSSASSSSGASV